MFPLLYQKKYRINLSKEQFFEMVEQKLYHKHLTMNKFKPNVIRTKNSLLIKQKKWEKVHKYSIKDFREDLNQLTYVSSIRLSIEEQNDGFEIKLRIWFRLLWSSFLLKLAAVSFVFLIVYYQPFIGTFAVLFSLLLVFDIYIYNICSKSVKDIVESCIIEID